MTYISKAVEVVGSQTLMAEELAKHFPDDKLTQQKVWNWLNKTKQAPAKYIQAISSITKQKGSHISVDQLLSDHRKAA